MEISQLAIPSKQQLEWQDHEIGMFIHWAPNVYQELQGDDCSTSLSEINPYALDTEQWVKVAMDLGAKYIVMVVKHCGGFCVWQTETSEYGIKNTPWKDGKGDILRDLSESCKKHDIKLGVYLSPMDVYHGVAVGGICKTEEKQKEYDAMYRKQLEEVLSNYGEMMEVWFDGNSDCDVGDLLEKYAPNAVIFQSKYATIRWVGNEGGMAQYPAWTSMWKKDAITGIATSIHSTSEGDTWIPMECDTTIRLDWFWSTTNHVELKSLDTLMETYYRSVGNAHTMLLNSNPDRSGRIPEEDAVRAKELGNEIRKRFSNKIADTKGEGNILELDFGAMTEIDHVIIMENTAKGERIRKYTLEGFDGSEWFVISNGTQIGHKRIERFSVVKVNKIKLNIQKSIGTPDIRTMEAYYTGILFEPKAYVQQNDQLKVGEWGNEVFWGNPRWEEHVFCLSLDLSHVINDITNVGQNEFMFEDSKGNAEMISCELYIDDIQYPQYVTRTANDTVVLYIPGIGGKLKLKTTLKTLGLETEGTILHRNI